MPSVIAFTQSKIEWFQAMSSVCTTADAGIAACRRSANVDLPPALRPSTATSRTPVAGPGRLAARSAMPTARQHSIIGSGEPGALRIGDLPLVAGRLAVAGAVRRPAGIQGSGRLFENEWAASARTCFTPDVLA